MKKLFISQPTRGKTDEEILAEKKRLSKVQRETLENRLK